MCKRVLSLVVSFAFMLTVLSLPINASQINPSSYSMDFDGVTYTITESVDIDGNKVITVEHGTEISVATKLDDNTYSIVYNGIEQIIEIGAHTLADYGVYENDNSFPMETQAAFTDSDYMESTPYGYHVQYGSIDDSYGHWWKLSSGILGVFSAYDRNNSTARNEANSFMSNIISAISIETAIANLTTTTIVAEIVAALLSGIGLPWGSVVAILASITSVVEAHSLAYDMWDLIKLADHNFVNFKAYLGY